MHFSVINSLSQILRVQFFNKLKFYISRIGYKTIIAWKIIEKCHVTISLLRTYWLIWIAIPVTSVFFFISYNIFMLSISSWHGRKFWQFYRFHLIKRINYYNYSAANDNIIVSCKTFYNLIYNLYQHSFELVKTSISIA